jgi:hypothetical protein
VLCPLGGTGWILNCYLDEFWLQRLEAEYAHDKFSLQNWCWTSSAKFQYFIRHFWVRKQIVFSDTKEFVCTQHTCYKADEKQRKQEQNHLTCFCIKMHTQVQTCTSSLSTIEYKISCIYTCLPALSH